MSTLSATPNGRAYRLLRRLLQAADCSLERLGDEIGYDPETIRSWGKRGRAFPADPRRLAQIVQITVGRARHITDGLATDALQFLVLAGYPPDQLGALLELFPPDAFQRARQAALGLREPGPAADRFSANLPLEAFDAAHLPPPQPLPPGSVPPPFAPAPRFRGRDDRLTAVFTALRAGGPVALTGMGGVGKTLLASELAHRFGWLFGGGVFWLNAERLADLPAQIARCGAADALALHPAFHSLDLARQLDLVRAAWAQPTPRLIVLDNAEELEALALLAPQGGCRVLITSQRGDWQRLPGLTVLPLRGLARAESIALLAADLEPSGEHAALGDLDQLAAAVGDLPLGLLLAGRYLHQPDLALAGRIATLLQRLHGLAGDVPPGGATAYPHDLPAMVRVMLARLDPEDTTDRRAADLLGVAACLAPGEPIARPLLIIGATGVEPDALPEPERRRYTRAIDRLLDLGLLERDPGAGFHIHRLIAAAVGAPPLDAVAPRVLAVWRARFAQVDPNWATPQLAHLQYLTDQALASALDVGGLLALELGWHLTLTSRHAQAITYQERSLALLRPRRGWDDESAEALCRLALAHQGIGQMQRAEHYWDELLEVDRRRLPPDSLALALTYNNVGYIKINVGKFAEARELLRAALVIRHTRLPLRHMQIARTLYLLCRWYWYAGRYRKARRYLQLAIMIAEACHYAGATAAFVAGLYGFLGVLAYSVGDYRAALEAYQRSRAIALQHFGHLRGPDGHVLHQSVAWSEYALGQVAAAQGDGAGALRHYRAGLALYEQLVGAESPETANIVESLGVWYGERGGYAQALSMLHYSRDTYRRIITRAYPELARIGLAIGRVHIYAGAWDFAAQTLDEAEETMIACGFPAHPLVGWIAAARGELAAAQGAHEAARAHYRRAIGLLEREAPEHPLLALYRLRA